MAANHPQLGAALSNVADLNRIYREHQRESAALAEAGRHWGLYVYEVEKMVREASPWEMLSPRASTIRTEDSFVMPSTPGTNPSVPEEWVP